MAHKRSSRDEALIRWVSPFGRLDRFEYALQLFTASCLLAFFVLLGLSAFGYVSIVAWWGVGAAIIARFRDLENPRKCMQVLFLFPPALFLFPFFLFFIPGRPGEVKLTAAA